MDYRQVVGKAVHSLFDGGFVVKGTGAYLAPRRVQRALKRPCDGVCRGCSEVLPCAVGLPGTGVQQVIERGAFFKGRRFKAVVVIDGVLPVSYTHLTLPTT